MAKQSTTGKLTDIAFRQAKTKEKSYKLSDGGGLYLLINPNGSRYWRLKYRIDEKEKVLALGVYPTVSAKEVRKTANEAKLLINEGVDPGIAKKQQKASIGQNTFSVVAQEWHKKEAGRWSEFHLQRVW